MKCKCGNEQHKPRVNPFPVSYRDVKTKEEMIVLYNGGMCQIENGIQCWFCTFPNVGVR